MEIQIRSKRMLAGITVIAAVLIAIAGTFAWNSITQQRINLFTELVVPGVNLHDDFDSPNKDVYVENSGDVPVIVRVRLTEFLQTAGQESLVAGHVREGANETDNARLNWTPHSGIPAVNECEPDDYHTQGDYWSVNDWFHEYYTWTMGGQKYYMPAKELLGQVEDELDEDFGEYIALLDNPPVCDDPVEYTYEDFIAPGSLVRQTLNAEVITMADWLAGESKQGDFWVVDVDGWCYWAKPLDPQTATGLLLNSVERTDKAFGSDAEYCINVWLQAADEIDIGLFGVEQNGGATESAKLLTQMIANRVVLAEGGEFFENKNDGSFVQLTDNEGNVLEDAKPFIPLGAAAATATAAEKVNTPEENKLYVGDRFNFMSLEWDGESYTNYEELAALEPPLYNIVKAEDGEYSVIGCEIGADGKVYLKIEDGEGTAYYLASVLVEASGARAEIFAFTNSIAYKQGYPGTGPFGIIYPGAVGIGSAEDTRYDPELYEGQMFYHLKNGVYIRVENDESTESIDEPVRYYFAETVGTEPYLPVETFDASKTALTKKFPLQMDVGDGFDLVYEWDKTNMGALYPRIADIKPGGTMYTLQPHMMGAYNAYCYFELGDGLSLVGKDIYGAFTRGLGGAELEGFINAGGYRQYLVPDRDGNGEGTEANPYKVRNRIDMEWISYTVAGYGAFENSYGEYYQKYIKVVNDFSMGSEPFMPISADNGGAAVYEFEGIFDGGGYTISNLKIIEDRDNVGLFRQLVPNAYDPSSPLVQVKNVKLANVNIQGQDCVGGIAGRAENGVETGNINAPIIENCEILSGRITGKSFVGGVAGASGAWVTDCKVTGNVTVSSITGTHDSEAEGLGGIAGRNVGTIADCVNSGEVIANDFVNHVGGIAGDNALWNTFTGTISGSVNNGKVDADEYTDYIGGIAGYNGGGASSITNCTNNGKIYAYKAYISIGRVGEIAGYGSNGADNTENGEIIAKD